MSEPKKVKVIIKNNSSVPVLILSENVPDLGGRLFRVAIQKSNGLNADETRRGKVLNRHLQPHEYTNKEINAIADRNGTCVALKPGESINNEIDLSLMYILSSPDVYLVTISVPELGDLVLAAAAEGKNGQNERAKTATVRMKVVPD